LKDYAIPIKVLIENSASNCFKMPETMNIQSLMAKEEFFAETCALVLPSLLDCLR
jgi:hypothetical protein